MKLARLADLVTSVEHLGGPWWPVVFMCIDSVSSGAGGWGCNLPSEMIKTADEQHLQIT